MLRSVLSSAVREELIAKNIATTWLVSSGVPINDVSAVMGHEQTSTTLDRYTHPSQDRISGSDQYLLTFC